MVQFSAIRICCVQIPPVEEERAAAARKDQDEKESREKRKAERLSKQVCISGDLVLRRFSHLLLATLIVSGKKFIRSIC